MFRGASRAHAGRLAAALWASTLAVVTTPAGGGTLVVSADTSDPAPRAAFERLVADFEREYPDVEVELEIRDHESFKSAIRALITSKWSDVVTWYPGERMRFFVDHGLFEDVSDLWQEEGLAEAMPSTIGPVTLDGRQYGVPYTQYQWGIFYRKDLLARAGLEPPETWSQLVASCRILRDMGVVPITIGTEALWPAAGWFDYLDLRINGLDFHLELTSGKVPYTDPRVRNVLEHWRELLDEGCFIDDHARLSWQDALRFMIEGEAAMYLLGNFVVPFLEQARVIEKTGFVRFPVIDPEVPLYEEAPIDTVHIPSNARNKEDARRFLAFIARPEQQTRINRTLGQLPANRHAEIPDKPFLHVARRMLNDTAGLAQFYDRDTYHEMARNGMAAFQEFMRDPTRLDEILNRLEISRRLIYEILRRPYQ